MPELPEVETVVRTLEHKINGRIIKKVNVLWKNLIEYPETDSFCRFLENQKFEKFERRGKFLIFRLTDYTLIAHLRMEGKFYVYPEKTEPLKHTHIVFELDEGELHYNDVRKFGRFYLYGKDEELAAIKQLGYEPWDDQLTADYLKKYCRNKNTAIKSQLLDQNMIAGIGNIYANEICFDVKINPQHPACFISREKWEEIIASTRKILAQAIKDGGTTIRSYTSSLGVTGLFQQHLNVHSQNGKECHCGTVIEKIAVNGRGTYFCPKCQKEKALLIAVTGNIGSGKSTVTGFINDMEIPTISCDEINSNLWNNPQYLKQIREITGKDTKAEVREVIYNDSDIKERLETYLHELIWQKVEQFYNSNIRKKAVVVEVPLLFETDWYRRFDCNILVCSNKKDVVKRLVENRDMSLESIEKVLSNQIPDSEKRELADVIIENNASVRKLKELTGKRINDIIKTLPKD